MIHHYFNTDITFFLVIYYHVSVLDDGKTYLCKEGPTCCSYCSIIFSSDLPLSATSRLILLKFVLIHWPLQYF